MVETDDEIYEVEKILNHKVTKGIIYYKLKWKGFPMSQCTWEKESNLDCKALLDEYWKNIKQSNKLLKSPNNNSFSPQNKKNALSSYNPEAKNFESNEKLSPLGSFPTSQTVHKKIDTSSLPLNPSSEREGKEYFNKIKEENAEKKIIEKTDPRKKKEIQSQLDKYIQLKEKKKEKDEKIEKIEKIEKRKPVLSNIHNDHEIIAASKNPKNDSVLYLVKYQKNDETVKSIVTSEYARKNLAQPLLNFHLNHLILGKPV